MTADTIAHALEARRSGRGWIAKCPAHEDRTPSLRISSGRGGVALVHCFGGCEQRSVIAALADRGLWSSRERPAWTPATQHEVARAREFGRAARWFAIAARDLAQDVLEAIGPCNIERASLTALLAALQISPESEYRKWLEREPVIARALARAGQKSEERIQVMLAQYLTEAHA